MKYLKQFEELNPNTYISAGNKLKDKYQTVRGNNLIGYGIKKRNDDQINHSVDKNIYKYNINSFDKLMQCKFIGYEIKYSTGINYSIEDLINRNNEIGYAVSFIFENIKGEIVLPFTFEINLYSKSKKNIISHRKLISNIRIRTTVASLIYNRDRNSKKIHKKGLFADRKSAVTFTKEVLPTILDDPDFNVSEVVSLLEKPISDLENIYNIFNKIDINYLYGDNVDIINNTINITKKI